MQNKRFLQLTIAAVLISVSSFIYVQCSIHKIEIDGVETTTEQVTDTERIGLGFFDIEIAQKIGATFNFLRHLK